MDNEHNSIHIAGWNRVWLYSEGNNLTVSVWHKHKRGLAGAWVAIEIKDLPLQWNVEHIYAMYIWPQIRVAVERCREEIQRDIDEMDTNSG